VQGIHAPLSENWCCTKNGTKSACPHATHGELHNTLADHRTSTHTNTGEIGHLSEQINDPMGEEEQPSVQQVSTNGDVSDSALELALRTHSGACQRDLPLHERLGHAHHPVVVLVAFQEYNLPANHACEGALQHPGCTRGRRTRRSFVSPT